MNVSYRWVRELAPGLEDSPRELADRLAMYGAPVDEIVDIGSPLKDVLIARVAEVRRHPNAERLSLCRVDAGGGYLLSVVCGAPNVQAERYYPFIPEGGVLPGGLKIRRAKIRGEESQGMLCSARELGLGRDHEGILELQGSFKPGDRFIDAVHLDDVRLAVDVTPNRPDLLSHFGIAREVAPGGAASLVLPAFPGRNGKPHALTFNEDARSVATGGIRVTVEDANGCPRYTGTAIVDVRVGPSPEWLASRLRTIGLRPINNVVDATNYVLHELGQPLHAFDLQSLGGAVVIRQAKAGESLVTLDGERRALAPGMLLIADATRPIALAGVMGGLDTEVTANTRDVFLECAIFDPRAVRHTRRALGMSTDASYRFERGVDPDGVERAVERAVELLVEVAGGDVVREVASVSARHLDAPAIRLRATRVEQVLGASFTTERITTYLENLGFRVEQESDGAAVVHVPGHRRYDVFREDDLVEEIARRHGYDAFPDDVRPYRPSAVPPDPMAGLEDQLRTLLVGRGFFEARGAAFAPPEEGDVALLLPLSSAESRLRRALVPGLAHRVEANFNRGGRDIRLFELGTAFSPGTGGLPVESTRLAAVLTGSRAPVHWSAPPEQVDVWDLKGLATEIANALGLRLEPLGAEDASAPAWLDSAIAFRWTRDAGGGTAGYAGRMRDAAIDSPAWAGNVWALELDITSLTAPHQPDFRPLAAFPAIERDVALIARHDLPAAALEATIRAAAGDLLEEVFVFDVYRGEGLPAGRRSIAFRLRFRAADRTLTDQEIDDVMNRLLGRLRDEHEVERRA
jgi:phenylalanyl-tRNA synthetase beta chain